MLRQGKMAISNSSGNHTSRCRKVLENDDAAAVFTISVQYAGMKHRSKFNN